MARCHVPITVLDDLGNAVSGASVTVRDRTTNQEAEIWSAEYGGAPMANPLSTDAHGRVIGWVERGKYRMTVSGSGIASYDAYWDAAPAGDGDIDLAWLTFGLVPLGIVLPYSSADEPTGWLRCNGQEVSRTAYPDLWQLLGVSYGAGNNVTTFNVPDLRGRAPAGDDAMGAAQAGRLSSNRAMGNVGGYETHVQSGTAGAHTHGFTWGAHTHSYSIGTHSHSFSFNVGSHTHSFSVPSHTHTFSTGSAGGHNHGIGADGNHQHGVLVGAASDPANWYYVAGGGPGWVTNLNHYHGGYTDFQGTHSHGGATGWAGDHTHSGTTAAAGGAGTTGSAGGGSGSGSTDAGGGGSGSTGSGGGGNGTTSAGTGSVTIDPGSSLQPYQIVGYIIKAVR